MDDAQLLTFAKENRPEWVAFLKEQDLTDVGNDPKRHTTSTRQKFWSTQSGGSSQPAATPAADSGSSSDSSGSDSSSSDSSDSDSDDEGSSSSSSSSSSSEPASKPKTEQSAEAFIKENRPKWVEWLKKKGLSDAGNDPKRHGGDVHARFHAEATGSVAVAPTPVATMQPAEKPAAVKPPQCAAPAAPTDDESSSSDSTSSDSSGSSSSDSSGSSSDDEGDAKETEVVQVTAATSKADSNSDSDSDSHSASSSSSAAARSKPSVAAVFDFIKKNRAKWVEWIQANGLSDVGNDPTRHKTRVHNRFYAEVAEKGAKPAAVRPPPKPALAPKSAVKPAAVGPAAGAQTVLLLSAP